ncbi:RNA polymerase sigma factor [Caldanaerobacter subterraneus]|uniref:DNA-directed RNA polymerase specialized sigma subunits, sigma24 homologs n=3 Tax=Caldanaerobacter subterraneus TaxID=911092 RepID=Q8RCT7_CALS4|nr:sigma-70 family RNA polymerase sigma factor [Caldanaerobacter subterraneus]AAM23615.1 DNA-directed RNA polymerase specialized sigma subunits, sigma24 homologs [Caldanaerobacter subterraneus subsp. tengcongensis MB4]KKC30624.1 sigma24-like protein [Caldanaerobacter subterraneus subsp. pacificus DSM 12653]MCS3916899.1 RNA polymerase sigma-70 factor (ECF subfamily) [Caldanaerobacter subterraneus subsp. tengcongensis MB4]TCO66376.1 RNA polymerase sigma-70 factor (ECF subfamily) [Caldanaerobacter
MPESFIEFYEKNFDDVYRYVYFKVGNKWDADDIVSETFQKAFEKYNTVKSNSKAWIFSIARNTVTDYYRMRKNLVSEELIMEHFYPDVFEDKLEREVELDCLKKSLYSLSKEEIEIVNLKYFANMTHREISQLIEKTEEAVKAQAYRIIQKLKNLVIKCLEG